MSVFDLKAEPTKSPPPGTFALPEEMMSWKVLGLDSGGLGECQPLLLQFSKLQSPRLPNHTTVCSAWGQGMFFRRLYPLYRLLMNFYLLTKEKYQIQTEALFQWPACHSVATSDAPSYLKCKAGSRQRRWCSRPLSHSVEPPVHTWRKCQCDE